MMKIRIPVTVEIDADSWAYAYGIDKSEVREDVKSYFQHAIQSFLADQGYNAT